MTMDSEHRAPLACAARAIPVDARAAHFALIPELFGRTTAATPTDDGYRFEFPPDALEDIARFVANERRCCPFLRFTIEAGPGTGPARLRIAGPPGTRALLEAELPIAGPAS